AGDAFLRVIATITGGPLHGAGQTFAESVFGILSLLTIAIASGFGFHQTDDEEERDARSISIGWLVHAFLSFNARAVRSIVHLFDVARALAFVVFGRPVPAEWLRRERQLGEHGEANQPMNETGDDDADTKASRERKANRKSARTDRK